MAVRFSRKNIARINKNERDEIDNLIQEQGGLVFHEIEINRIVSDTFKTELSYFLAYNDKDRIIGVCPLHTIKKGVLKLTYSNPGIFEMPYGGWVFDKTQVTLNRLLGKMKISCNESLTYRSAIQIAQDDYQNSNLSNKVFKTAIIDLRLTEDDIFSCVFSANKRNKIRRAMRAGVTIKSGGMEYFEQFYDAFLAMKERTGLRKMPKTLYSGIADHYCALQQCRIFLSEYEGKILSALLIIGNKNVFHFWLGGMFEVEKNLYQNDYIHWPAIKWAKQKGSRYYDLCVIEEERLPQIARFKLGFSKNLLPFYQISRKPLTFKIINRIKKWL